MHSVLLTAHFSVLFYTFFGPYFAIVIFFVYLFVTTYYACYWMQFGVTSDCTLVISSMAWHLGVSVVVAGTGRCASVLSWPEDGLPIRG